MDEGLLICLVENHPNLYDKKRGDFKDSKVRENSWEEISSAMGASAEECQRVWRNLRDRYVREKKALKEVASGSASSDPKWSLFNALGFLEQHILPRRTTSNVKSRTKVASRPSSAISSSASSRPSSAISSSATSRASSAASGPYDAMEVILSPRSDEGTSEVQGIEAVEEVPVDIDINMPSTSAVREPPAARQLPSEPVGRTTARGKQKKAEERIAQAMEGLTEYIKTSGQKRDSDKAFVSYVEATLGELSPRKKKLAKRQILEVLNQIEDDD